MERIILHSDMNSFYASVEQAQNPELRGKPVAVAGREDLRQGIILTKSIEAKKYGVKTAETLWEARRKCPDLIVVPPNYALYKKYSSMARDLYNNYTDLVEPFGLDESWLDITGSAWLYRWDPYYIAQEISNRIKDEMGVTVSIGVSWNKIFAKFGSDYKKPDAITVIDRANYKQIVWESPVRELLYVGPATERKLHSSNIQTIGDLAHTSDAYLKRRFGKIGFMLRTYARGEDTTPVKAYDPSIKDIHRSIKSYGNGLTAPHDLVCVQDAKTLIWLLTESVAQRLREDGVRGSTVSIGVRRAVDLSGYERQVTLQTPTAATRDIARAAWSLLEKNEPLDEDHPLRALHVRVSGLSSRKEPVQLSLLESNQPNFEELDLVIDDLRKRYGNTCVVRGSELANNALAGLDIKKENTVHPVGIFNC